MQLRDHPLMNYRGIKNWPPVWVKPKDEEHKTVIGEVGTLAFVLANPRLSGKCFLVIDHNDERYVGALLFDDKTFCKQVAEVLITHLNRPISEIGGLDLSHTL